MKRFSKLPYVLISVALASIAGQSIAQVAPGWSTAGTIQDFSAREWGADISILGTSNPMGCATTGWVRLKTSQANYQSLYSLALSAAAAHKPIKFWISGCDADGTPLASAGWANL